MFEEYTEDYFLEQARELGDQLGVDTREGSVYMDAATGHCMRTAKFYEDLRNAFDFLSADTCCGEVLEEWAKMWQITRKSATPSYYTAILQGASPKDLVGDRFMAAGYYFVMVEEYCEFFLRSEKPGTETNYITPGTMIIPVKNTNGLTEAVLGDMYAAGTDAETDESLRTRWTAAMSKPAENGNKKQFQTWCEAYNGVGRAIITPLGYGPNTVKALIISSEGTSPPASLIEQMQEDIDPGSEGLGQGKALIGCKFYAVAAKEKGVRISFAAELAPGYTAETAKKSAKEQLTEYIKKVALETPENEEMKIVYVKVIGIIANTPGIKDFSDLSLNGSAANITITGDYIPLLKELTLLETGVITYAGV